MRNLRNRYTYEQRDEFQRTIGDLRQYILPVLLDRQGGVCNRCGLPAQRYDLDHLIYNPMMTINELQALCEPCHAAITNYIPIRNR